MLHAFCFVQVSLKVVYADDPRAFGPTLQRVFPGITLRQDGWHLLDRPSRCIPKTNTLKSE